MTFEYLCDIKDVPPGTTRTYEIKDRTIALCNVQGNIYAVDDMCTHEEESLDQGQLDGFEIECPRHGARFDVRTGEVKALPAVLPIDTFNIRVDGKIVEIEI